MCRHLPVPIAVRHSSSSLATAAERRLRRWRGHPPARDGTRSLRAPVRHPAWVQGWRTDAARMRSDQGCALTGCVVADVVDLAGDETSGYAWGQSRAVEVPRDGVFDDGDGAAGVARVGRGDVG